MRLGIIDILVVFAIAIGAIAVVRRVPALRF